MTEQHTEASLTIVAASVRRSLISGVESNLFWRRQHNPARVGLFHAARLGSIAAAPRASVAVTSVSMSRGCVR
jgi:hypothetical protein